MIPAAVTLTGSPWPVLSPGIHRATLGEVENRFAINEWRRSLFAGLVDACGRLLHAGCQTVYLDGSYVCEKPIPGDYDGCWDPAGVDPAKLDPVFRKFANKREAQKREILGEFFPSSGIADSAGSTFLEFFQIDKYTGQPKGIISISLLNDPLLSGKTQP